MSLDMIGGLTLLCLGLPLLMCAALDCGLWVYCWLTGREYER